MYKYPMTSHASPSFVFRFTRSAGGYAVGYAPTLDTVAAGAASLSDGRHLGRVVKIDGAWQAIVPSGTALGEQYRTRAEAATALLVTAERVAALDALPTDDEPAEGPAAPVVTYRKVGGGLYEVVVDGTAAGRVARTTPEHVTFGARWSSYTTTGERIASAATTRESAGRRVVDHARFATVDADTITNRRDLLAAVEVQTQHLGYASAAAYLQAPGREVTRARAEVAAYEPDGPAMPAGVGGCDCSAVPGPHLVHCDDCSAPVDACVCDAPAARLAARYGVTPAEVTATAREVVDEALAPAPRHWTREEVLDRLRATGGFDLVLGPDDTAYDLEVGDTMLGGVTLWYAYGEFPGTAYRTIVLDDEPAVDDDPREQPAPLEWSEHAGS